MKKFEFVAGTSKDDIVMGLCLPVSIMLPALTTYLIIFYSERYASFRSAPLLFRAFVFVPALYLTYFLIKKARKNAANKFVVNLDELSIRIWKNEKEVVSGKILSCKIKASNDKLVHVDIGTEEDNISFRARPKEYRTITGNTSFNPFGTGTVSDMETVLALGVKIKNTIEKQVLDDNAYVAKN